MSGPWEKYAAASGAPSGPWDRYASTDAGLSFRVTPDASLRPATRLADVMASPGPAVDYLARPTIEQLLPRQSVDAGVPAVAPTSGLDAAGSAFLGSLVRASASVPFLQAGISDLRGDTDQADQDFARFQRWKTLANQLQTRAQQANEVGSVVGNVAGFVPQLLTAPTLALGAVTQGIDPATTALERGKDLTTANELLGIGAGAGTLQAALPASFGTSRMVQALAGAALGGGINTGAQALEHTIAPDVVQAPEARDAAVNTLVGSLLGVGLGKSAPRRTGGEGSTGPTLSPDALFPEIPPPQSSQSAAGALPRGADFVARSRVVPDREPLQPIGESVAVDAAGRAFTPVQGRQVLGDALRGAQTLAPPRLGAPVVNVESADNAATSADFLASVRKAQADAQAKLDARQARQNLGITPDIERTQGDRWASTVAENAARADRALFAGPSAVERSRAAIEASDARHNDLDRGSVRPEQVTVLPSDDRARNLRRFMVGSKVVDAQGRPLMVYHGTNEEFSVFDAGRSGGATAHSTSPLGHFFTENKAQARHYAENASSGVPAEERVVDAHLAIKNPTEWTIDHLQRIDSPEQARRIRRSLEKSGFDGIHIKDAGQWIAFKPEQIKSSSENRGTFDPASPDIRFSRDTGTGNGSARHETHPSGVPKGLPVESTPAAERISAAINRSRERAGDQGRVLLAEVEPERLPAGLRDSIGQLEALGSLKVHVVRNITPEVFEFNGVTTRNGAIFLAEDAQYPLTHVAAHEFGHQLSRDHPYLWRELVDEWERQGLKDKWAAEAASRGYNPHEFTDEAVADGVGDALNDPEFLERMAQRNPSAFRRIAEAFRAFLDNLLAKLGRIRDLGSERYWQDVQAFRDKLADVLDRYAREKGAIPFRGEDAPMYSRKPDAENEHLQDMPSRRPGESQSDYMRRVFRRNGDEIRQAVALAKYQRTIGRLEMRAMWAKQARAMDIADRAFVEARKMFDRSGDVVNLATIDEWENGRRVTDADAREFFASMQDAFDQRIAKIRAIAPDAMQQLIDHYFPHIWEDSSKALKWYQAMGAKRPLEGDKSFLKQRTWGTIREGMASGLKPVSTNPVDLVMLKLGQMDKFIAFNEMRQNLQQRGWLRRMEAGERVPLGYARVDDPAFQIAGGLQGYYAVPELIAKDINNYLSPSLYRFAPWKSLRAVQNVLMSARLGWSMFHAGFTTMDNLVMHADVAARRFMDGDVVGGLSTLLKTPLTVVWSPIEGHKLNREWLGLDPSDAHTAAVLDMLEQGGAHRTMSSTEYQNALPKFIQAVRRRAVSDSLKEILPAVGEASSWIIHHWLVPNQKIAARVMLAKFELDRMAGKLGKERGDYAGIIDAMHPDVVKQLGAHVVNAVDDRLGQMNYDNQFWNKTAREVSQAFIGAVGWQVGTVRTVTGGVRDLAHLWAPQKLVATLDKAGNIHDADMGRVSGRLTYLVSLALMMGGLGAITQYLLTGEGPQEVKDYFFPKTGRKNDDGSDERLQYPSYWMDHYKLATHPLQTAMHKIHPSIGMFMEALANQDYFGVRVRNEDASWWQQAGQVGEYVAKGFLPYSWTGHQKLEDAGTGRQVANFFGITKAPASVSRTPFQAFVAEKAYAAMPKGSRTPEQAEATKQRHMLEAAIRRGENPDLSGLSSRDQRNAMRASRDEVPAIRFRRLSINDKMRAYDIASPQERDEYKLRDIILRSNWRQSVRDLSPDERQAVIQRILAIRS